MEPVPEHQRPDPSADAAAWRAALDGVLKGADFDAALVARSRDGIPIGPLHPKAERGPAIPWRDVAVPVRVFGRLDATDLGELADLVRIELEGGATGLTLAAATLPTLLPRFGGAALRLDGSHFAGDRVRHALADRLDGAPDVDWGLDPLGGLARLGTAPAPWPDLVRDAAAEALSLRDRCPDAAAFRADGRAHHEAGGTEAQELAAVLASALAYLRALEAASLDLPDARARLGFTLAADADQFMTLAKCRALRRLWARVEEACGLDPAPLRLHAETARRMLTRRDPATNLLRNTVACAAAILGGADSVAVLPHTAALGPPDAGARRLARTTPLVLLEEAGLARVADPAAGSGGFEHLTDALAQAAWSLFRELEGQGGLAAALASGAWQRRVAGSRASRAADLAANRAAIVGTTIFPHGDDAAPVATPPRAAVSGALPSLRDAEPFEEARP